MAGEGEVGMKVSGTRKIKIFFKEMLSKYLRSLKLWALVQNVCIGRELAGGRKLKAREGHWGG